MKEKEKICFVIMGFGKKKDPSTNRTIDLDETYNKIIYPAVKAANLKCIRADEILDSGIIDRSMYALLYHADLVIADISTYNPNAIYELGTRHTLRPFSTIVIKEDQGLIPFDFNHNRCFSYQHLGNEISKDEAKRGVRELKILIESVLKNPCIDSPIYTYIKEFQAPKIKKEELDDIIKDLKTKENSIYFLTEKAKQLKQNSRFKEAADEWQKLSEMKPGELYYIQQQALCTYKSDDKAPSVLMDALTIINNIKEPSDTETLGILGAINKRLWLCIKDQAFLERAMETYKKGWTLHNDYYNGENYALCLEQLASLESEERRKIHKQVEAEEIRTEVIEKILSNLDEVDGEDLLWRYATLAHCHLALGNQEGSAMYEAKFKELEPEDWMINTFQENKDILLTLKKK